MKPKEAKGIVHAEARIPDLTSKVEELTAASARLDTDVKNLEKEVAVSQEAQDEATAIRQTQLTEFNGERDPW